MRLLDGDAMARRTLLALVTAVLLVHVTPVDAAQTACYTIPPDPDPICREVLTIPISWTHCSTDADCTLVPWDCCGCTQAGFSIAISRDFMKQYEAKYGGRCHDFLPGARNQVRCPQEYRCDVQGNAIFCDAQHRCQFGFR
jgi:hypothetical protein